MIVVVIVVVTVGVSLMAVQVFLRGQYYNVSFVSSTATGIVYFAAVPKTR